MVNAQDSLAGGKPKEVTVCVRCDSWIKKGPLPAEGQNRLEVARVGGVVAG